MSHSIIDILENKGSGCYSQTNILNKNVAIFKQRDLYARHCLHCMNGLNETL